MAGIRFEHPPQYIGQYRHKRYVTYFHERPDDSLWPDRFIVTHV